MPVAHHRAIMMYLTYPFDSEEEASAMSEQVAYNKTRCSHIHMHFLCGTQLQRIANN